MKFTLIDYQAQAVADVLDNMKKARVFWQDHDMKTAFSLAATTGSGKTVMAAAVFEALLFGNDELEFEPDPGAVVIWFSDDPSLNTQSKWRLQEASDKLTISDLVTVENTFNRETLEAGKIYFLNTQKLSKSSLLTRGHDPDDDSLETADGQKIMPDMRAFTIWDTIRNTIENPDLTLYLVLDEAHRGMKADGGVAGASGRQTIVKQLINGSGGTPAIPIVWGISATVDRFNKALKDMQGRTTLPHVQVDAGLVQASGLLKDTITMDVPDEVGDFETVLLRRGADKLREITEAWAGYAYEQGDGSKVQPLLVLQVPDAPNPKDIGKWLDIILERFPDLPEDSIANVFGEHKTETFGRHTVPYIEPQRVQQDAWVRILIAKNAISTGWDCPRAEVMVSLRAASDRTHITQLLGRMVRTPLARRISGNDRLNAVDCLLPHFNKETVTAVVDELMKGGESGEELPGRRVLINPREMKPNPAIPEEVWEKLTSLPSQTLPKKQARPVKRLTALAHELAMDDLLPDAGKKAHEAMHAVLDASVETYATKITEARASVLTVEGKTLSADTKTREMSFDDFVEAADYAVIEDAYKRAGRAISPDLATTYAEHLAGGMEDQEDEEEALIEAHTIIAAIGLVPKIKDDLEAEAEKLAREWLGTHKGAIKGLTDERQEAYRQIREMSTDPLPVEIARPHMWLQPTTAREPNGKEYDLERFEGHLLCDEDGLFPDAFNSSWEPAVLRAELQKEGSIGWYRNPARASQDSLGVVYEEAGENRLVRPDFIFFVQMEDGSIAADLIDPHGDHLADALPKLKGLTKYAARNLETFRRMEAITKLKKTGTYRMLDLTNEEVREAVEAATSAEELYGSPMAEDYVV
ncbi:Type III restriction enzyme, res subunit [Roseivivax sp. THAF40]|uniref:DEAD/DEAH box helicase n=1 Tax=unclassified Roseivivax TaxID=2639302 RepID=UPI0012691462|nr:MULTISPECIES: DEAD/DEAH box helicase family protein [unclassified Roseivivax]QFS84608.1 Type III restriction enzyme, res subunit [Roseivivax sp. THAF197b]QFT48435.1 Type III restriction enzyme, res subunit [Roseivivax sp. THAF40]